jgi:hypothetical protein
MLAYEEGLCSVELGKTIALRCHFQNLTAEVTPCRVVKIKNSVNVCNDRLIILQFFSKAVSTEDVITHQMRCVGKDSEHGIYFVVCV